jgi:hypothetical protein
MQKSPGNDPGRYDAVDDAQHTVMVVPEAALLL